MGACARLVERSYRQHVRNHLVPCLGGTLLGELANARVQAMFTGLIRT
jgi:hypothetical protein